MVKTIKHKGDTPYFGDEPLLETAANRAFSAMIFELLSGIKPRQSEAKIFEAILNLSIDHGKDTPSAIETIRAAGEGKNISESVAAGILKINDMHGGAIEPAMDLFYKIKKDCADPKGIVEEYLESGNRIPGFGHRIYEVDPRTQLLFGLVRKAGLSEEFIDIAINLEGSLKEVKGKALPVNIDGAIAAVLCTFGWDSKLGKAVFIIARTPGLCGQYLQANSS